MKIYIQKVLNSLGLDYKVERDGIIIKNFIGSFFLKGAGIFISLLVIPLTIDYISIYEYGVWLTVYSIMNWLMYFDGGLASGLRNHFTESLSKNNIYDAKSYVSTSYICLSLITLLLIPLFYLINFFLDWNDILNVDLGYDLDFTIFLIFVFFCFQFVLRLIDFILIGDQKPYKSDLINFISNFLSLFAFIGFSSFFDPSLLIVACFFSLIPSIVKLIYTIFAFTTHYSLYKPSFSHFNFDYLKPLLNLGKKFFVIQICGLITVGTINFLILKFSGPEDVVEYTTLYKYYFTIIMFFTIVTNSIFSSITDAYFKNDFNWIRKTIRLTQLIVYFFIFILIVMLALQDFIFQLWLADRVEVEFSNSVLMAIYVTVTLIVMPYSTFISSVGKVYLSYLFSILNSIIFIPLTILALINFGLNGVFYVGIMLILPGLYWLPIQYKKIISRNASSIWNK